MALKRAFPDAEVFTGHLVVTTSHAGSLIESIGNILQAARAVTPSDRSNKGGRLLAVVHLKAVSESTPRISETSSDGS